MKIPFVPCLLAGIQFILTALAFFCTCFLIIRDDTGLAILFLFFSFGALATGLYILYDGAKEETNA